MSVSRSIKISYDEMSHVEEEAKLQKRSIGGQAEHWIRIGRAIEESPQFNYGHVKEALQGLVSPDDLSGEENAVFSDEFFASFTINDKEEPEKLDAKKYTGDGNFTGLDDDGELWGYNNQGDYGIVPITP